MAKPQMMTAIGLNICGNLSVRFSQLSFEGVAVLQEQKNFIFSQASKICFQMYIP